MTLLLSSYANASSNTAIYEPKDVSISSDGRYIATVEFRSKTKLWDLSNKKLLWMHQSKGGGNILEGATSVDISNDGTKVVFGDNYDKQVVVLDSKKGAVLKTFQLGDNDSVYEVRFSPDGTQLAASGNKITVWNLSDESVKARFKGFGTIDFSPDGKYLVSYGSDNTIKLWDIENLKLLNTFEGHTDDVRDVKFSNNGKWIASGSSDKTFRVWDVKTGKQLQSVLAHTKGSFARVNEVIFSKDDKFLITAGQDRKIKLWDVNSGKMIQEPYSPAGCVRGIDISGNGETVVIASKACTSSSKDVSLNFVENFTLCCSNISYERTMIDEFKKTRQINKPKNYYHFIEEYSNEFNFYYPSRSKMIEDAKKNYISTSNELLSSLEASKSIDKLIEYSQANFALDKLRVKALSKVISLYEKDKKINQLKAYLDLSHITQEQKNRAISAIYSVVEAEDNKIGYKWFIDNYPKSKDARRSLRNIYRISFNEAKEINSIEAYNDFIVVYPYSAERKEAERLAYSLEDNEFSSYITSDAKLARALSIKAKQTKRKASETGNKAYLLIVARMTRLLEDKFPAEHSTERHLENEEILAALKDVTSHLKKIDRVASKIADNTTDLSSVLQEQSRMMDSHFKKAAQDRSIAEKYSQEHRNWERYLRKEGL